MPVSFARDILPMFRIPSARMEKRADGLAHATPHWSSYGKDDDRRSRLTSCLIQLPLCNDKLCFSIVM
jgi:hypothetical protein